MQLLTPQTAAANVEFIVQDNLLHQLVVSGLAGAEEVTVKIWNGAAFQNCVDASGTVLKCTLTRTNLTLPGLGHYQLAKPITAGASGIVVT